MTQITELPASTKAVLHRILSILRESNLDVISIQIAYSQGNNEVMNASINRVNDRIDAIDALISELDVE